MPRTKVQNVLIENKGARKLSLKKRTRGLIKKMNELSTLCGVECCFITYSPGCPEPDLWPSRLETEHVIHRYRDMPDFEQSKKMADQESFSNQELAKALKQLNYVQNENKLKELEIIINQNMSSNRAWLQSLDSNYLAFLNNHVLKPHLEKMEQRIAMLNEELSATAQEH